MRWKFRSNCSLFLISILSISYVLYLAFFKKFIPFLINLVANNLQHQEKKKKNTHVGKSAFDSRVKS